MDDRSTCRGDRATAPAAVVDVIIPALDERDALPRVLADLPAGLVREVVVVDNGSTDGTAEVAIRLGVTVVREPRRGYGSACQAGIRHLTGRPTPPEIVVFLDADYSDHPAEMSRLLAPLLEGRADLVVGSRTLGDAEPGALLPQARFGNYIAAVLIRRLYGLTVTDLGPFRAIRWPTLLALEMRDRDFGWTVEMQVRAARRGVAYAEVPVSYRRRIGRSKISGTLTGSVLAGVKILAVIASGTRAGRAARGR